ncbi:hypothetical protein KHA85_08855 [Dietzia sp. Marseille-Q0999]|nr:hypothetical protein [Dietzia massiliensis]
MYEPSEFGVFATVLATASVGVGFSSQRMEVLAQGESRNFRRVAMLRIALYLATVFSLVVTLVAGLLVAFGLAEPIWIMVGLIIWAASLAPIGTAALVIRQRYRVLAIRNFSHQSSTAVFQTVLGFFGLGPLGLASGFVLGRLTWLRSVGTTLRGESDLIRPVWRESRRPAVYAGSSALVNSASGQLLPILVMALFGPAVSGIVAMALRTSVTPLNVVGQAVASAAAGEVGAAIRAGDNGRARKIIKQGMRDQALIGIVPCAIAAAIAPAIAAPILGAEWGKVGIAISILAVGGYFQFVAAPFSQVLNISGNNRSLLYWDLSRLVIFVGAIVVPALSGFDWTVSLGAYSTAQVPIYIAMIILIFSSVAGPSRQVNLHSP